MGDNTYGKQFLHSGAELDSEFVMSGWERSTPDGLFQVIMPLMSNTSVFATDNRVEDPIDDGAQPDHDVITCKYHRQDPYRTGDYYNIDVLDEWGVKESYYTDASSLDSYRQSTLYQWILFSWTREYEDLEPKENYICTRVGRYQTNINNFRWMQDQPIELDTDVGPYSKVWTDVDLTLDDDFIVVWNQVIGETGIYISKYNYEGEPYSGYPKQLVPLQTGDTRYPRIIALPSGGSIRYIVTWSHKLNGKWEIVGVTVRQNETVLSGFIITDNSTLGTAASGPPHSMDTIYCPYSDYDRFAITWTGEEQGQWDIYYAIYEVHHPTE